MKYNPKIHNRRSIRLKGYDYSKPGLYYVTICVQNKIYLFGEIRNDKMELNDAGKMVLREWNDLPKRFQNIRLHEYIIMPNHFHAILEIVSINVDTQNAKANQPEGIKSTRKIFDGTITTGQPQGIAPTLGMMIGGFKSITTHKYIDGVKNKNWEIFQKKLWQRDFWDQIIRSEKDYSRITEYIIKNPSKWSEDKFKKTK